jgi:hypothetical protein
MRARKVPTKSQAAGEKAGEWASLWMVGIITFLVGLVIGGGRAIKNNVHIPDLGLDDEDEVK